MANYARVILRGNLHNYKESESLAMFERILQRIGNYGVTAMSDNASSHAYTHEIMDSLMWATAKKSEGNISQDAPDITSPSEKNVVHIGSASTHAEFTEYATSPHATNEDSAGFIQRITEWAFEKLGEDNPYFIIQKIRDFGTPEQRYMRDAVPMITEYASNVSAEEISMFWRMRSVR